MYRLVLVAGAGGDTVTRAGAFRMGGFEAEQHVASAVQAEAEPTDPFARLSEPQMDTLFAPLIYLATGSELGAYNALTVEGKRRFLRGFWRRHDPPPWNEQRGAVYPGIATAHQRARGRGRPAA